MMSNENNVYRNDSDSDDASEYSWLSFIQNNNGNVSDRGSGDSQTTRLLDFDEGDGDIVPNETMVGDTDIVTGGRGAADTLEWQLYEDHDPHYPYEG